MLTDKQTNDDDFIISLTEVTINAVVILLLASHGYVLYSGAFAKTAVNVDFTPA